MDPLLINTLLTEGSKLGFVVLLLLWGIIYLVKRDKLSDARTDAMVRQAREDAIAREQRNSDLCLDREHELGKRLKSLEDRYSTESSILMSRCAEALVNNSAAFRAITETPSGLHRLISGPRPS
jgi:hypothetical protein